MDITHYWQSINWLTILLYPISLVYKSVIIIRKLCYDLGCLPSYQALNANHKRVPVIIVGNISVGGNGKTPLIIHLLNEFKARGYHPGVVSRGYGAINPKLDQGQCIIVDTSKEAKTQGDEPWMIAKKTSCPVVVGRKRSKAVRELITQFNCDIVLSDDGMQHYAMARDIEICVVDTSKNFGNGLCLPAGPLREPKSRLNQVDYIVYHQTDKAIKEDFSRSESTLNMHLKFDQVHSLTTNQQLSIANFKAGTIHAIAGIASPQRFFNQLKQAGLTIIEHPFADHHQYQLNDLDFNDNLPIIMTEKDAVKCIHFNLANCYYISVKAVLSKDLVSSIVVTLSK